MLSVDRPLRSEAIAAAAILVLLVNAASALGLVSQINDAERVVLPNSVQNLVASSSDLGRLPGATRFPSVTVNLMFRAHGREDLEALLAIQQNPVSSSYHSWLTPEEFGLKFGLSDTDLTTVSAWLASHGLLVRSVARGRTWLTCSGTAAQFESAFHTEIHALANGRATYQANVTPLTIPLV